MMEGIELSFTHAAALAQLVNATLSILIPRELELMNSLKASVVYMAAKITWGFGPQSSLNHTSKTIIKSTT